MSKGIAYIFGLESVTLIILYRNMLETILKAIILKEIRQLLLN